MKTVPYTYYIKWSTLNLMYYGVKYAEGCHPDNFWVNYFTSSKVVREYREKYGEPDIYRVSKRFATKEEAIAHEGKFLKRVNAVSHSGFLNKSNGGYPPVKSGKDASAYGKNWYTDGEQQILIDVSEQEIPEGFRPGMSDLIREQRRQANLGENNPNFGNPRSAETKERIRIGNIGKKRTVEQRENISMRQRGEKGSAYGKNWYTDGEQQILIDVSEQEIPEGFRPGMSDLYRENSRVASLGKTWVNNNIEERMIDLSKEDMSEGYVEGRLDNDWRPSDEHREKNRQAMQGENNPAYGKTWVNNGEKELLIDLTKNKMPEGYTKGQLKRTYKSTLGRIFITNDIDEIMFDPSLGEIPDGYRLGRSELHKEKLREACLGKIWANNGITERMIDLSKEDMPEGYIEGRLKRTRQSRKKNQEICIVETPEEIIPKPQEEVINYHKESQESQESQEKLHEFTVEDQASKHKIIEIFNRSPKAYIVIIKQDLKLVEWIMKNSQVDTDSPFKTHVYSAYSSETDICSFGNKKKLRRFSDGFIGCGPANICQCTKNNISGSVARTKSNYTDEQNTIINAKRDKTMIEKYGVTHNLKREVVKSKLRQSTLAVQVHEKLTDKEWMTENYIIKERSALDIAKELDIYYGTVIEYCKKLNFKIRQKSNYSLIEGEVAAFIESLGFEVIKNDRNTLKGKEIDILIPSKNLGIEINGLYWHGYKLSRGGKEDKNRHVEKTRLAASAGIKLLQFTDLEWHDKKTAVEGIIKSNLGVNNKIYARNTVVKEVCSKEQREFLDKYHMQGYTVASTCLGLYHNNELQMLGSISKNRFKKDSFMELVRVCSKNGTTVVGGLSKLVKKFKIANLITYCDLSYGTGQGYKSCGFDYESTTDPGYFWTDGSRVFSRYKCQRSQLAKWLPTFDMSLSESQNMFNAGYLRYWNCGNSKWKFTDKIEI